MRRTLCHPAAADQLPGGVTRLIGRGGYRGAATSGIDALLRMIGTILLVLAALAGGGAFALARLIEPEALRAQLVQEAEESVGASMTVQGRVDLDLLPWPTITMAQATVTGGLAASPGATLEIERLELQIAPLSVLGGEVRIEALTLIRPTLRLRGPLAEPSLPWSTPGLTHLLTPGPQALSRLGVMDGRAVIAGTSGPDYRLEGINFEIEMESERGPFSVAGGVIANGQIFQMSGEIGRVSENSTTTLHLEIDAGAPEDPFELTFRGLASGAGTSRLQGRISVAGDDIVAGTAALAAALGSQPPELPAWLGRPYEVTGALLFEDSRVEIDDLSATLAGTTAHGRLELAGWPAPRLDLALTLPKLDLPDQLAAADGLLAPLAGLASSLTGEIDLTIGQIAYRGDLVQRVRLELGLADGAAIAIREARAMLPGNTDLAFTGRLQGAAGKTELQGLITIVTERFRSLLGWLGADPSAVPSDRLQSFSLTSALEAGRDSFRLMDAEVRVDASHVRGSLALERDRKPRLAATIDADRLDLDSYAPGTGPGDVLTFARSWLADADVALDLAIERLLWRRQRWSEVMLDARSIDGKVILDRFATRSLADATADFSGEIDLAARQFDLTASMTAPRPALLLSRFGVAAPLALARLTPLTLHGRASGWRNDIALDLELGLEEIEARLTGAVAWPEGEAPSFELDVEVSRPGYGALLDKLALTAPGSAGVGEGPLQLTGKLLGRLDREVSLAGTATLGVTRVTGQIAWHDATPRPRFEARLSLNEPELHTLLPPLALAGLRLDPGLLARPIVGNWPTRPMALDWLGEIDANVEISGKGGFAGEGLELQATLKDRHLTLERATIEALGGAIEGEASLHLDRPSPLFALALDLRQIDAAALADVLGVPPVLHGRLDLRTEATAIGNNPFELVRSLFGYATVELGAGRLLGLGSDEDATSTSPEDGMDNWPASAEIRRLAGRLEMRRGIARAEPLTLDLDQARGEIRGVVDLLVWAVDLELTLETSGKERPPLSLRIVGPIDAPQVVRAEAQPGAEGASVAPQAPDGPP
jgi:hypothetical protein